MHNSIFCDWRDKAVIVCAASQLGYLKTESIMGRDTEDSSINV